MRARRPAARRRRRACPAPRRSGRRSASASACGDRRLAEQVDRRRRRRPSTARAGRPSAAFGVLADDEAVRHVLDARAPRRRPSARAPGAVVAHPHRDADRRRRRPRPRRGSRSGGARGRRGCGRPGTTSTKRNSAALQLGVRRGEVHRLVVERLQRVARCVGSAAASSRPDLEQLALHRRVVDHAPEITPVPCAHGVASRSCSASSPRCMRKRTPSTRSPNGSPPRWATLNYELILVNDGSKDGTRDAMARAAARDPRVKVVALSRNFGHQPALTAGLEHARGDAIVMIDGDLQDPPEVIPEMLDALARGRRRRLRRARAAAGARRLQARHRARLLPHLPPPRRRPRPRRRVRRLPPDGPHARSTRCSRCPSATASCAG